MKVFEAAKNSLKLSVVGRIIRFLGNYLLSWLLFPEDYGILAIAVASTEIFGLINQVGLQAFYIQDTKTEPKKLYSTVLIIDIILSFSIFIIISAFTFVSWHNGLSNNIALIMALMGLNLGLSGLSNTRFSDFKKQLDFKNYSNSLISSDILSTLFKLVFAYIGWGASSFIGGELIGTITKVLICLPFFKQNFSIKMFDKTLIKKISWFGKHSIITALASYITINFDKLYLYRVTNIVFLGFYNFAVSQTNLFFSFIISPINDLLFSTYPKVLNDYKKLNIVFSVFHFFVSIIVIPFYVFIILNSKVFINSIYSNQWIKSSQIFIIFSFQRLFQALCFPAMPLLVSNGRPDISSKFKILKAALVLILSFLTYLSSKNVIYLVVAFAIGNIIGDLSQFFYSTIMYKIKLKFVIYDYLKIVILSVLLALFTPIIFNLISINFTKIRLMNIAIIITYSFLYIALIYIFYYKHIKNCLSKIKSI
ncbi:MAG: oligosaccharide flippase family protein [Bacteroidetes bacterium]|nr:oligosaccharide flippase family protein [Bacteroidota bacterium]